ncbi:DsbA family protein [Rhodoblastus acidophilus]|uniref:DsbA family protein n=1 Tax=Candidatus Rhodoblastus alkanivorans TaxID=2954117 RepID=A0ABS9ZAR7_9HYPH|nr:DsbA family protein [Candidatus Rhodoblastus alkanivorans]MCI4677082.1 DsbA family protein [Candidatus Rhodoblastus alkanivorans]MCI4684435.1 DsbA family protein [Candidatus Rhodoblastus alkanivorans]MDI4641756.1 DsbA family protein [Rhodoblastus acidophilus]
MSLTRSGATRRFLLAFAAVLCVAPFAAHAQAAKPGPAHDAGKETVDALMAAPPLPDVWLGSPDAPVTIIEYASMTCGHCARFEDEVFPILKKKYIDTGKVRYTMREFPLDPLAAAAAMLARCSGDKRQAMIELLFTQQKNWAYVDKPLEALRDVVKQTGIGPKEFDACLNNQSMFDKVSQERNIAAQKFGIDATPTFFINGDKKTGEIPPDALDGVLAPYLKK